MIETEIQEIEQRLVSEQLKKLAGVPKVIRDQLARMAEVVLTNWEMDTVYYADVQLKMFQAVAHSTAITLDVLEVLINHKSDSKTKFERWLKRVIKHIVRERKKNTEQ